MINKTKNTEINKRSGEIVKWCKICIYFKMGCMWLSLHHIPHLYVMPTGIIRTPVYFICGYTWTNCCSCFIQYLDKNIFIWSVNFLELEVQVLYVLCRLKGLYVLIIVAFSRALAYFFRTYNQFVKMFETQGEMSKIAEKRRKFFLIEFETSIFKVFFSP